ncbi:hydrogenase 1, small subunit [Escherichia coli]|nr:hydrogenase 1, small subunit [Escherichia coli]
MMTLPAKVTACTKWAAKGLPPITPVPPHAGMMAFLSQSSLVTAAWAVRKMVSGDRGSFYSRVVDIPQMGTHSTADTVGLTALGVVAAAVGVHAVASAVDQRRRHNQQPTETEHQPGNEDKQA